MTRWSAIYEGRGRTEKPANVRKNVKSRDTVQNRTVRMQLACTTAPILGETAGKVKVRGPSFRKTLGHEISVPCADEDEDAEQAKR